MRKRYAWALAGAGALVIGAGVAVASSTTAPAAAPPGNAWLHVRVEEPRNQTKVSVNLPMGVVQAVLEAAPDKIASHGCVHLHDGEHDLKVADLRRIWAQLKTAPDGEMVSVDSPDEKVQVARRGDRLEVHADRKSGEAVRVDVPVVVVDALFAGEGERLDVAGALREVAKLRGDLVTVHDEHDATVRVWIDEGSR